MINFLKNHKKELIAAAILIFGVALILFSELYDKSSAEKEIINSPTDRYTEYLEEKIEAICKSIEGITEAEVLLTLDCSSEYIYGSSSDEYLILEKNSEESALLVREIYPKVRGIAVVCTGGDLPRVQEKIAELISAAVGLPISKIKIGGM